ncbi:YhcN/YlaJ family sporulation lipoprotein [Bacillus massilinigeriensis]|uniref:YhcN/YlaJ family sporulation lipoprotein n=1 Tax=Bacillus mediterraneensis TaxID=1805474 RepID=UPI0008F8F27D|nr:YhcN/YlaJ family sporulation lipoprotein [Bacillus mediterraneensis]
MKAILIALSFVILSGCVMENQESGKEQLITVKNTTNENVSREDGKNISQHLETLAESVPGVSNATAVVIGRYAVIGIDIDSDLDRSKAGTLKYSVAESLKDDPNGAKAMIVADPDMTARLKEVAEDIKNGEPGQGILNELSDITGRVMPEVPADLIDPNPKTGTEKPKKQLNHNDKQKLEKDQEEQSNNYKD